MILVLLGLICVAWILIFIFDVIAFYRLPWMAKSPAYLKTSPLVSILVAARNEATAIEQTLSALLRLDYPNFKVILIDDQSSDGTGEIAARIAAKDSRLLVISGTDPPADWIGKSWALHQGVKNAPGEWLLFTDADCIHHPSSLRTAIAFALDKRISLVSLVPALSRLSLAEKLIMPAFVSFLGTFFPLGA